MITDGKPTCLKENGSYYKNSNGLDTKIVNKCLALGAKLPKIKNTNHYFYGGQRPLFTKLCTRFYRSQ